MYYLDHVAQTTNNVATPQSSIMNGKGVFDCDPRNDTRCTGEAEYYEVVFQQNTTYKISVMNTGSLLTYSFYIDGHSFSVIENDFVPIEPYETDVLNVGIGEHGLSNRQD